MSSLSDAVYEDHERYMKVCLELGILPKLLGNWTYKELRDLEKELELRNKREDRPRKIPGRSVPMAKQHAICPKKRTVQSRATGEKSSPRKPDLKKEQANPTPVMDEMAFLKSLDVQLTTGSDWLDAYEKTRSKVKERLESLRHTTQKPSKSNTEPEDHIVWVCDICDRGKCTLKVPAYWGPPEQRSCPYKVGLPENWRRKE